ncbi:hypothetical protein V6N13_024601 [Hibiscus sabdariffa]
MATSSSSSAEGMPPRFSSAAVQERYDKIVAAKNRWEEQWFFFDDSLENYGLEPIIYKSDDTVTVRGRRVPANSTTINNILDLPNDSPSIYALIDILEDENLDTTKDQLCKQGTEWNVQGKNPKTINRPHLQPEAKLWNTFVKRNLMPTSHNQTVDRTRLVLINAIITGYKFNVGEVITRELSAACQNDKDKYTVEKSGWTRKEYMRKMEIADATPIQMVMPTPPASEQAEPSAPAGAQPNPAATPQATPATSPAPTPTATPATPDSRQSTPDSPLGSAPTPPQSPPPAQSEEAIPLHILHLRSQLQQIEARQLQFIEETKVFQTSFINFLCFQFPNDVAFFTAHTTTTQPTNFSASTQPKLTPNQSEGSPRNNRLASTQVTRTNLRAKSPNSLRLRKKFDRSSLGLEVTAEAFSLGGTSLGIVTLVKPILCSLISRVDYNKPISRDISYQLIQAWPCISSLTESSGL